MLMVSGDLEQVENELMAGRLRCPRCGGRVARWGWASWRNVRSVGGAERRVRPRRSRCVDCEGTHVLLPDELLVRRRDEAKVIGGALVALVAGDGHRRIAERIGVPAATVRGWLRRFAARAAVIAAFFTRWALTLAPGSDPPAPTGTAVGDAVEAVGMATRAAVVRFGPGPVWARAARLSGVVVSVPLESDEFYARPNSEELVRRLDDLLAEIAAAGEAVISMTPLQAGWGTSLLNNNLSGGVVTGRTFGGGYGFSYTVALVVLTQK